MTVTANGKPRTVKDGASIDEFLHELDLAPDRVVVEHNGRPLRRESFKQTMLRTGDRLEIAQMVGGG